MNGWDLIIGLWLLITGSAVVLATPLVVTTFRDLRAAAASVTAGHDTPRVLFMARGFFTLAVALGTMALCLFIVGVAVAVMVHAPTLHSPVPLVVYVVGLLCAAIVLALIIALWLWARSRYWSVE